MKTSIELDPGLWRQFRIACIERGIATRRALEALIRKQLKDWEKTK
jgi:hypothetical protein